MVRAYGYFIVDIAHSSYTEPDGYLYLSETPAIGTKMIVNEVLYGVVDIQYIVPDANSLLEAPRSMADAAGILDINTPVILYLTYAPKAKIMGPPHH